MPILGGIIYKLLQVGSFYDELKIRNSLGHLMYRVFIRLVIGLLSFLHVFLGTQSVS